MTPPRRPRPPRPDDRLCGCFKICVFCGHTHSALERRRVVLRMLPCTLDDVLDGWSCLFEGGPLELLDTMHELGATYDREGVWSLP